MKKTASRRSFYAFFCLRAGGWVLRRPGGEQVLRLRARDGAFRAPARVTFFFCQKKVTKENHSNLRFKDPLARGGQVQIWRCWLRGIGAAGDVVGSGDYLYRLRRCRWCGARVGSGALEALAIIKSRLCRLAAAKVGVPVGHGV